MRLQIRVAKVAHLALWLLLGDNRRTLYRLLVPHLMDQVGAGVRTGISADFTLLRLLPVSSVDRHFRVILRIATARNELGIIQMSRPVIIRAMAMRLVLFAQHHHRIRPVIQIVETLQNRKKKKTKQTK